jgi:hypothetical protein
MTNACKATTKLLCASITTLILIVIENHYIQDPLFRRQLILMTVGGGLIVGILLSLQMIGEIIARGLRKDARANLISIRNAAVVAVITGYLAFNVINIATRTRLNGGTPDKIDVAEIVVFSFLVIVGIVMLVRMFRNRCDTFNDE